jgi:hypothetical protein
MLLAVSGLDRLPELESSNGIAAEINYLEPPDADRLPQSLTDGTAREDD